MSILREESLAKKLISKGSLVYFFSFLVAPAGYIARVIASHTMSVEDVGIFFSVLGFIGLLAAYNDLGLSESLQYFLPKYWIEKKYNAYKTIWRLTIVAQLISGVIVGGGLRFGADWLAVHYFGDIDAAGLLRLFSVYFVSINIFQTLSSTYTAFQHVLYDKITDTVRLYGMVTISVIFWFYQSFDLIHFGYAWLGGLLIGLLVSIGLFLHTYTHTFRLGVIDLNTKLIKKQFAYAFWIFLGINVSTILGQIDQQIVVLFLGAKNAGYYSNYLSLLNISGVVLWPLFYLIFPITTELVAKNQQTKIQIMLSVLYKYFSVLALMLSGFMIALGPQIALTLYGKSFLYAGELLSYSAAFSILTVLFYINFGVLAGMGEAKIRVKILAIALVTNIALNIFFITKLHLGILGVIIATVLSQLIVFVLSYNAVSKTYPIHYDRIFVGRNFVVICFFTVVLFGLRSFVNIQFELHGQLYSMALIALLGLAYTCIILGINYKNIIVGLKQIRNLGSASA